MIMTIEEGLVQKDTYEVEVTTNQALRILISINHANELWISGLPIVVTIAMNIILILKTKSKYYKWYLIILSGCLLFFPCLVYQCTYRFIRES
ncbi:hypothetical protein GMD78_14100 [Ornithinibacillus sp. L9]|uniref:Uncharacterized protein n=1 Tax=Ornithinibacillus caprae TaxID=2678566 RepID=A0A6N8FL94_9BACI|nr:hypothetical protein [Ornithinibacillus caprae]MUK89496.1 hypothetical protein [Ornithinibacillus caprae]